MAYQISIKSAYQEPQDNDGYRMLVDRLWPRGVAKATAQLYQWDKNVAPSNALREELHHEGENFNLFKKDYLAELNSNPAASEFAANCIRLLKTSNVTLVYSSSDHIQNNAVVLKDWLSSKLD